MRQFSFAGILILIQTAFLAQAEPDAGERVILHTTKGDLAVVFFPEAAPMHAARFSKIVKAGVYNGTAVKQIEKGVLLSFENFAAKSEPLTEAQRATVEGVAPEIGSLHHTRGMLSTARHPDQAGLPDSSFSIVLGDVPDFDSKYTVFRKVEGGFEALAALENTAVNEQGAPIVETGILSAEVTTAGNVTLAKPLKAVETQVKAVSPVSPDEQNRNLFLMIAGCFFGYALGASIFRSVLPRTRA